MQHPQMYLFSEAVSYSVPVLLHCKKGVLVNVIGSRSRSDTFNRFLNIDYTFFFDYETEPFSITAFRAQKSVSRHQPEHLFRAFRSP
jgi:hypothetical protein